MDHQHNDPSSFDDCDNAEFADWLRRQADRDDPVGDLARDFMADDSIENAAMLEFVTHGAAYEAFQAARSEFLKATDQSFDWLHDGR
jgi:hypothetical protein